MCTRALGLGVALGSVLGSGLRSGSGLGMGVGCQGMGVIFPMHGVLSEGDGGGQVLPPYEAKCLVHKAPIGNVSES